PRLGSPTCFSVGRMPPRSHLRHTSNGRGRLDRTVRLPAAAIDRRGACREAPWPRCVGDDRADFNPAGRNRGVPAAEALAPDLVNMLKDHPKCAARAAKPMASDGLRGPMAVARLCHICQRPTLL